MDLTTWFKRLCRENDLLVGELELLFLGVDSLTLRHAIGATLIYTVFALISLWVDRRALMLSAMSGFVFTYNQVLAEYGVISLGFAITGLLVGVGLLVLSVYWSRCRITALKLLPARLHRWVVAQKADCF